MPEIQPPSWLQTGQYSALADRRLLMDMAGDVAGRFKSTDLDVTALGSGMSVAVAAGACLVASSEVLGGGYYCLLDATKNLTLAASDTAARRDIIQARVYDSAFGRQTAAGHPAGANLSDRWFLEVKRGAAGGAAPAPAVDADALLIATILVPANSTVVTSANITNNRVLNGIVGAAKGSIGFEQLLPVAVTALGSTGLSAVGAIKAYYQKGGTGPVATNAPRRAWTTAGACSLTVPGPGVMIVLGSAHIDTGPGATGSLLVRILVDNARFYQAQFHETGQATGVQLAVFGMEQIPAGDHNVKLQVQPDLESGTGAGWFDASKCHLLALVIP